MSNIKYQGLTATITFCAGLIFAGEILAGGLLDDDIQKYTSSKLSLRDYVKQHPELSNKIEKSLTNSKKNFIIKKDDNGNPVYNDPRN